MLGDLSALIAIAVAMVAGLLISKLMKLIGLPNVTGYLIVGVLLGPYFLGLFGANGLVFSVKVNEQLKFISNVALGFIAFSIGGEFKLSHIKKLGKNALVICCFQAFSAVILVDLALILFAPLLHISYSVAIILGAIATATAPAATLMVVRQYKAKGIVTDTLLPVVAFDDAIGLIVFAVSLAISQSLLSGAQITVMDILVMPLLEIVSSLAIGFAIGALMTLGVKFFKSEGNRLCIIIASVLLGVGLCEIFQRYLDFELSSLLLCMSISLAFVNISKECDTILAQTETWTPPLLMLFFILSGSELNLQVLPTVGWLGVIYILVRSLGKYFGTYVGSRIVKADKNVRRYLGFALLPQAGVAIGMATICVNKFPSETGDMILAVVLCATLIYELVGPFITKLALQKAGEIKIEKRKKETTEQTENDVSDN